MLDLGIDLFQNGRFSHIKRSTRIPLYTTNTFTFVQITNKIFTDQVLMDQGILHFYHLNYFIISKGCISPFADFISITTDPTRISTCAFKGTRFPSSDTQRYNLLSLRKILPGFIEGLNFKHLIFPSFVLITSLPIYWISSLLTSSPRK